MLQEIKCIPNETSDKENPYLTLLTVSNLKKVVFIIYVLHHLFLITSKLRGVNDSLNSTNRTYIKDIIRIIFNIKKCHDRIVHILLC